MKYAQLIAMIMFCMPLAAADYSYKFQLAEVPADKAIYRINLEKLMMVFDAQVKSIIIREGTGVKLDLNYIVTVNVEIDIKRAQSVYDESSLPKAVISPIVVTK